MIFTSGTTSHAKRSLPSGQATSKDHPSETFCGVTRKPRKVSSPHRRSSHDSSAFPSQSSSTPQGSQRSKEGVISPWQVPQWPVASQRWLPARQTPCPICATLPEKHDRVSPSLHNERRHKRNAGSQYHPAKQSPSIKQGGAPQAKPVAKRIKNPQHAKRNNTKPLTTFLSSFECTTSHEDP